MLTLNLHYFDNTMQRANSLKKTLMLGMIEGKRRSGWQDMDGKTASLAQWTEFEQTLGDTGRQRDLACCSSWVHRAGNDFTTKQ